MTRCRGRDVPAPHRQGRTGRRSAALCRRRAMDDAPPPEFSDETLALRFADQHESDLRYVAAWGRWMQYTGQHWQFDDTLHAFDLARTYMPRRRLPSAMILLALPPPSQARRPSPRWNGWRKPTGVSRPLSANGMPMRGR